MNETIIKSESFEIANEVDLVNARRCVRSHTIEIGLNLVQQTKVVTATSELARNLLDFGKGGFMQIEQIESQNRIGIRLSFVDRGPGIIDIDKVMTDGFSSIGSMGLGLPGSRRLVNEFKIDSKPGQGTHVTIIKWK